MTPRPAQTLSLKGRALRYLAAREHSRAELATKLSRHVGPEDDPDAVARVLDELAAKGFIDEARVAESVLHRRAGRLGGARVLQELRAKGLPDDVKALAGPVWEHRIVVDPDASFSGATAAAVIARALNTVAAPASGI